METTLVCLKQNIVTFFVLTEILNLRSCSVCDGFSNCYSLASPVKENYSVFNLEGGCSAVM